MRKAKLPIAVFIVLMAVALVFAGCEFTTSVSVNFVYPDGSTSSQVYQSDEGSPSISESPDAKYIVGQHFTGWYLDQAFAQPVKFPYELKDIETLTLYANYVAGYAVTLSGGSPIPIRSLRREPHSMPLGRRSTPIRRSSR